MTTVGGNLEQKEIGLPVGISGIHNNTEIDSATGYLRLAQIDTDGQGNLVYAEEGTWISDVINLGDKFTDFEKVFSNSANNGSSSFAILTRVSDNNMDWSDWTPIALDGTIQSDTKQYIQVRIDLFAGFVTDVFLIPFEQFENNSFTEKIQTKIGSYVIPKLTSNTSSSLGFAFSSSQYNATYDTWKAFDATNSTDFITANLVVLGYIGFCFASKIRISKYKIRSTATSSVVHAMPKNWVLEGSNNTVDGHNGEWEIIDTQNNQNWAINVEREYEIINPKEFHSYRIRWTENNGHPLYTRFAELNFFEPDSYGFKLKRDYTYDMTLDSIWEDEGSLHRKKITREEWVKIDRLEVVKI
ncbi:hypothetical protein MHB44_07660 [Lysinibacillus sp. FSL H8-0500]|uniref:hypothetical protein n=1 Tax=Lysinibacillus sp. FSL H8-0500 TaxID=2921393 RepID=UPI003101451A